MGLVGDEMECGWWCAMIWIQRIMFEPSWGWVGTWMYKNLWTWMKLRKGMDAGNNRILRLGWFQMAPGWRWDAVLGIWMGWAITWMEVIWRQYRDLDWGETWSRWIWGVNLGDRDQVQISPGWMWDGNLWTWMEVRRCMDGGKIISFRSGLRWDRSSRPVRRIFWNPDGFEMVSVLGWDKIFGTCMELRYLLYGGQTQMCEPGLRWDTTWMDLRC